MTLLLHEHKLSGCHSGSPTAKDEALARITVFSTGRQGGVSSGSYAQLNIYPYSGDAPEAVAENRRLLAAALHMDEVRIVLPRQIHGTEIRRIVDEFFDLPAAIRSQLLDEVDALITDTPEVCIGVSTADCIPVVLYDEEHHCAAVIHAGWKGTLEHIVQKTLVELRLHFGTQAARVHALIGPGIGMESFEVGQEVYEQFAAKHFPMDTIARLMPKMRAEDTEPLKWHIDLKACNVLELEQQGVPKEQITDCGIDTYLCADDYFSARRLGAASGRIYTGIVLR